MCGRSMCAAEISWSFWENVELKDSKIQCFQIDVDRIISRRQERVKSVEGSEDKQEERISTLEHIDNETAIALAVDQLLDTSFLISDEELACYVPSVSMEVVAARRDHVWTKE